MEVNLGCGLGGVHSAQHKHRVLVNTYLGYGTNEARSRYYKQLLKAHLEKRCVRARACMHVCVIILSILVSSQSWK